MRIVDTNSRKRDVLFETIKEYIYSAAPVSSETLKEKRGFGLSSATLRNVLAELEEEGFLMHPHTSAGRVPTDKGYRYYLEYLLAQEKLRESQKQEADSPLTFAHSQDLESVLEEMSDILAELTHYAGIVSSLHHEDKFYFRGLHFLLEQPEFYDIARWKNFLTMLDERARLLQLINSCPDNKINIYVGSEAHCDEFEDCSLVVNTYSQKGAKQGHLGVLGPKRMDYSKVISTLEYLSERLSEFLNTW
jgi:heat-inducible transcriptional repressor